MDGASLSDGVGFVLVASEITEPTPSQWFHLMVISWDLTSKNGDFMLNQQKMVI